MVEYIFCPSCGNKIKLVNYCIFCGFNLNFLKKEGIISDLYNVNYTNNENYVRPDNMDNSKDFSILNENPDLSGNVEEKNFSYFKNSPNEDQRGTVRINNLSKDNNPSIKNNFFSNNNEHENITLEINSATADEIAQFPGFNRELANKIISLRKSGIHINSLTDLYEKLNLTPEEIKNINEKVIPKNEEIKNKKRLLDI